MAELAHFKNFAKLKDTSIEFNDITVLAGKPSTGKSYVMKFMYAIYESINLITSGKNHILDNSLKHDTRVFEFFKMNLIKIKVSFDISEIDTFIDNYNYIKALELIKLHEKEIREKLTNQVEEILFDAFLDALINFSKQQEKFLKMSDKENFHFLFRNILTSIFGDISQINTEFEYKSNFLKMIYQDNIKIDNLNLIKNENTLFVETPLILEFEKFLPIQRFKTPYHIDSLLEELSKSDYSFTSEEESSFINEFRNSTSKIIKGNIFKGMKGFSFESQSGKNFNIMNTSSGIKSIGLLQYLVTNKALKKGSVLFWEEPEVHLHPSWQLKMVDLFVELMNAGVKIVFSTHSPYMPDYLNAISKRRDFEDRVSFNLLQEVDGVVENYILNTDEKWQMIQDELLGSLEEIMWEYI